MGRYGVASYLDRSVLISYAIKDSDSYIIWASARGGAMGEALWAA